MKLAAVWLMGSLGLLSACAEQHGARTRRHPSLVVDASTAEDADAQATELLDPFEEPESVPADPTQIARTEATDAAPAAADAALVRDAALDAAEPTRDAHQDPSRDAGPDACTGTGCADARRYDVGNSMVDDGWGELATQPGELYLVPIVTPRRAQLKAFKLIARDPAQRPQGGVCRMVIYTDSDNRPNALLTWTFTGVEVADGESGAGEGSPAIRLKAGARYWVGAECYHAQGSLQLRSRAAAEGEIVQIAHDFGTAFPDPFPADGGSYNSGTLLALFVEVQDLP